MGILKGMKQFETSDWLGVKSSIQYSNVSYPMKQLNPSLYASLNEPRHSHRVKRFLFESHTLIHIAYQKIVFNLNDLILDLIVSNKKDLFTYDHVCPLTSMNVSLQPYWNERMKHVLSFHQCEEQKMIWSIHKSTVNFDSEVWLKNLLVFINNYFQKNMISLIMKNMKKAIQEILASASIEDRKDWEYHFFFEGEPAFNKLYIQYESKRKLQLHKSIIREYTDKITEEPKHTKPSKELLTIKQLRKLYETYKVEDNKNILFVGTHLLSIIENEFENCLLTGFMFDDENISNIHIHNSPENKHGEGEYQLLSYLYSQSSQSNDKIVDSIIVSPDADMILLNLIELTKGSVDLSHHNIFIFNLNNNSQVAGQEDKKSPVASINSEQTGISVIYMNQFFKSFKENKNIFPCTSHPVLSQESMLRDVCLLFSLFAGNDIIPNIFCMDIEFIHYAIRAYHNIITTNPLSASNLILFDPMSQTAQLNPSLLYKLCYSLMSIEKQLLCFKHMKNTYGAPFILEYYSVLENKTDLLKEINYSHILQYGIFNAHRFHEFMNLYNQKLLSTNRFKIFDLYEHKRDAKFNSKWLWTFIKKKMRWSWSIPEGLTSSTASQDQLYVKQELEKFGDEHIKIQIENLLKACNLQHKVKFNFLFETQSTTNSDLPVSLVDADISKQLKRNAIKLSLFLHLEDFELFKLTEVLAPYLFKVKQVNPCSILATQVNKHTYYLLHENMNFHRDYEEDHLATKSYLRGMNVVLQRYFNLASNITEHVYDAQYYYQGQYPPLLQNIMEVLYTNPHQLLSIWNEELDRESHKQLKQLIYTEGSSSNKFKKLISIIPLVENNLLSGVFEKVDLPNKSKDICKQNDQKIRTLSQSIISLDPSILEKIKFENIQTNRRDISNYVPFTLIENKITNPMNYKTPIKSNKRKMNNKNEDELSPAFCLSTSTKVFLSPEEKKSSLWSKPMVDIDKIDWRSNELNS